ncbi:MAG TPA: UTP--glucose-1-phosphate uridylyltransferase [Clostridiaceae bacterium]|nr:UTP--glucose-1-phosphate uridylyltransferase [Clostridiaceae bacterium]
MEDTNIEEVLTKYNQTKLMNLMKKFTKEENEKIINQLKTIDLEKMINLYNRGLQKIEADSKKISNIKYIDKSKLEKEEKETYKELGENIIKEGKYAVVTMAGGQGTRLGHKGPKGTFKVSVNGQEKYLFQIIVESLQKAIEEYGVAIKWYIMVSSENEKDTKTFLKEHNYFGYPEEKVKFFVQGNLPLIDTNGQFIIDKNKLIKEASDGNGSIYESLKRCKILDDMKQSGIEWIFVGGVDNILLKIIDPILTGITIKENNIIASKSVVKKDPRERVGVFCKIDGKPGVIEYTELPEKMAVMRDEKGELIYGEVNILSHLYSIKALEQLADVKLPYHVAFKKANFLDENEKFVEVSEPNAYKFESFIFDAFKNYEDMSILRVKREDEFAPIKNATGSDSPETAIKLYEDFQIRNK